MRARRYGVCITFLSQKSWKFKRKTREREIGGVASTRYCSRARAASRDPAPRRPEFSLQKRKICVSDEIVLMGSERRR